MRKEVKDVIEITIAECNVGLVFEFKDLIVKIMPNNKNADVTKKEFLFLANDFNFFISYPKEYKTFDFDLLITILLKIKEKYDFRHNCVILSFEEVLKDFIPNISKSKTRYFKYFEDFIDKSSKLCLSNRKLSYFVNEKKLRTFKIDDNIIIPFFTKLEVREESSSIILSLHDVAKKLLFIMGNYTRFNVKKYYSLKNKYSKFFFILINMYSGYFNNVENMNNSGNIVFVRNKDFYFNFMEVGGRLKINFKEFRKEVLKPILNELKKIFPSIKFYEIIGENSYNNKEINFLGFGFGGENINKYLISSDKSLIG